MVPVYGTVGGRYDEDMVNEAVCQSIIPDAVGVNEVAVRRREGGNNRTAVRVRGGAGLRSVHQGLEKTGGCRVLYIVLGDRWWWGGGCSGSLGDRAAQAQAL